MFAVYTSCVGWGQGSWFCNMFVFVVLYSAVLKLDRDKGRGLLRAWAARDLILFKFILGGNFVLPLRQRRREW